EETKSIKYSPLITNHKLRNLETFKLSSMTPEESSSAKASSPNAEKKSPVQQKEAWVDPSRRKICFSVSTMNMNKSESLRRPHAYKYNTKYSLPMGVFSGQVNERAAFVREKKTAKTLAMVVGCFSVSWLPFFICYAIEPLLKQQLQFTYPKYFKTGYIWLGYINSVFNPFIYAFYNKEYANAFRRILRMKSRH
ncbi:Histamine H1 receptor, partial [Cichlidogyrus casuarinus]